MMMSLNNNEITRDHLIAKQMNFFLDASQFREGAASYWKFFEHTWPEKKSLQWKQYMMWKPNQSVCFVCTAIFSHSLFRCTSYVKTTSSNSLGTMCSIVSNGSSLHFLTHLIFLFTSEHIYTSSGSAIWEFYWTIDWRRAPKSNVIEILSKCIA